MLELNTEQPASRCIHFILCLTGLAASMVRSTNANGVRWICQSPTVLCGIDKMMNDARRFQAADASDDSLALRIVGEQRTAVFQPASGVIELRVRAEVLFR